MNSRKIPSLVVRPLGIAALLAIVYVAGFGPACWLANRMVIHPLTIARVYSPVLKIEPCRRGIAGYPRWLGPLGSAVRWYGDLGAFQQDSIVMKLQAWKSLGDEVGYAKARQFRLGPMRRAER